MCVVGARPNFVKAAPLLDALWAQPGVSVFGPAHRPALRPGPVGQLHRAARHARARRTTSASAPARHAEQTAAVLVGVEKVLLQNRPDALVVVGDVNSTVGAALAAAKLGVPIVHLESGLRSGDWTMPEEVNRVVTDRISDLLLCHCQEAIDNLAAEGITGRARRPGRQHDDRQPVPAAPDRAAARRARAPGAASTAVTCSSPCIGPRSSTTLIGCPRCSRCSREFAERCRSCSRSTRARGASSAAAGSQRSTASRWPTRWSTWISSRLQAAARLVVTDSGGVQEETSALGVPCLTYRNNTERPVTSSSGTNTLVGVDPAALAQAATGRAVQRRVTTPARSPCGTGTPASALAARSWISSLAPTRRSARARPNSGHASKPLAACAPHLIRRRVCQVGSTEVPFERVFWVVGGPGRRARFIGVASLICGDLVTPGPGFVLPASAV